MQIKNFLRVAVVALALPISQARASDNYTAVLGSYIYPDASRDAEAGGGGHLIYGIGLVDDLDLELNGYGYFTKRKTSNKRDYGYGGGLDLRYTLADSQSFGFYFLLGAGGLYEAIKTDSGVSPYADAGFSLNFWNLFGSPKLSFRTDARYYAVDRKDGNRFGDPGHPVFQGKNILNDAHFNAGLQYDFGAGHARRGAELKDSDGDGIIDSRDECPGTPPGTIVDGRGCPVPQDSDGDGVLDKNDQCPNTPRGTVVQANGCPHVEPMPVPIPPPPADSDHDGVLDLVDECPGTPIGTQVDPRGCPLSRDLDGDGVPNEADDCPNTPPGMQVDPRGCVIRQVAVFHNINFEFDSDKLTSDGAESLERIARGLKGQPSVVVEISGHTDSLGTQAYNLTLSQKRARAVKAYLIGQGIGPGRMQTEGYGEANPIASNDTEAGRAQNRRVEFKVLKQ